MESFFKKSKSHRVREQSGVYHRLGSKGNGEILVKVYKIPAELYDE